MNTLLYVLFAFTVIALIYAFSRRERRSVETYTPPEAAMIRTSPSAPGRWSGYTFKRIKKVGNFYAYGWILTDKRRSA